MMKAFCLTNPSLYYLSLESVKNTEIADLVRKSGIERSYCYQILNGTRNNPGRDKIIRLCLAAHLSEKEAQRALKISNEACLYVRNRKDAIVLYALANKLSCEETNLLLDQFSEVPLQ